MSSHYVKRDQETHSLKSGEFGFSLLDLGLQFGSFSIGDRASRSGLGSSRCWGSTSSFEVRFGLGELLL